MTVLLILITLFVVLVAVFAYRLFEIRRGGTPAMLRRTPAAEGAGWHYGILRYRDATAAFYRLSSLLPGPSTRISRQGIEVGNRRLPALVEVDIMDNDVTIIEIQGGEETFELCLDRRSLTAFLSWVESRPSGRSQRRRPYPRRRP